MMFVFYWPVLMAAVWYVTNAMQSEMFMWLMEVLWNCYYMDLRLYAL